MEKEKGFRLVQCVGCSVKLRLKISPANYGKRIKVICPKCKTILRVTIPIPPKTGGKQKKEKSFQDACNEINDAFNDVLDLFSNKDKK